MGTSIRSKKVFISYSWSNPEHQTQVRDLASALRGHGVDAILDVFDLKPGHDKFAFMESMVTDPDVNKVLVICDKAYQQKANKRKGGVGTESQIISQEIYSKVDQTKFIPVVFEYDDEGNPCLPVFMKALIYVDMSTDENYGDALEAILRLVVDTPLHPKPALGTLPSFLKPGGDQMPHANELAGTLRAMRDGKANREGLEGLFVSSVLAQISSLAVQPDNVSVYDEEIYQAIVKSSVLHEQVAEYAETSALFSGDQPSSVRPAIRLLEGLAAKFRPDTTKPFMPASGDVFKFFALEFVLVMVAALIRHERWDSLRRILAYPYIVSQDLGEPEARSILSFDSYLESLDVHRNNRLSLNRACLTADLLKERCSVDGCSFPDLAQADIFMAVYGAVLVGQNSKPSGWFDVWTPRTSVYRAHNGAFPVFAKCASPEYGDSIRKVLGVKSASEFARVISAAKQRLDGFQRLRVGRMSSFSFERAANIEALSS